VHNNDTAVDLGFQFNFLRVPVDHTTVSLIAAMRQSQVKAMASRTSGDAISSAGKESQQYFTSTGPNDVLLGRGAPIINYVGNVRFRELVSTRKAEYMSTGRHNVKCKIAEQVIDEIYRRNGKFLRQVGAKHEQLELGIAEGTKAWVIANSAVVREKVKQALRDKDPGKPQGQDPNDGNHHGNPIYSGAQGSPSVSLPWLGGIGSLYQLHGDSLHQPQGAMEAPQLPPPDFRLQFSVPQPSVDPVLHGPIQAFHPRGSTGVWPLSSSVLHPSLARLGFDSFGPMQVASERPWLARLANDLQSARSEESWRMATIASLQQQLAPPSMSRLGSTQFDLHEARSPAAMLSLQSPLHSSIPHLSQQARARLDTDQFSSRLPTHAVTWSTLPRANTSVSFNQFQAPMERLVRSGSATGAQEQCSEEISRALSSPSSQNDGHGKVGEQKPNDARKKPRLSPY
jgi:hypothetical protein